MFDPSHLKKVTYKFLSIPDKRCKAKPCNQAGTYENILANYCQADFGKYIKIELILKPFDVFSCSAYVAFLTILKFILYFKL